MVTLSQAECEAMHTLIVELSGGNASHVFGWDGTDDMGDARTAACAKVWLGAGHDIPPYLRAWFGNRHGAAAGL